MRHSSRIIAPVTLVAVLACVVLAGVWKFDIRRNGTSSSSTRTVDEKSVIRNNKDPARQHQNLSKLVNASYCENDDDSTASFCFDMVWPTLSQRLCPDMVPNITHTDALFSLARDLIGMRQWNQQPLSVPDFYRACANPTGFTFLHNNLTLIYMSIYKAASENVRLWGRKRLSGIPNSIYRRDRLPNEFRATISSTAPSNLCVLTAVRDPISHFLSGYNEIDTRILEREHTKHERMPIDKTPALLFHRYHYGTHARFIQFVADLLGVPSRVGWSDFQRIEPLHIYSMSGILYVLWKVGARLTAYLPSISNLNNKWGPFAYNACGGDRLGLPKNITEPLVSHSSHESSKDLYGIYKAAKSVWTEGGPTARALCALHAMDYACYQQLPDGVPQLCKEVYSSRHFVEGIMGGENSETIRLER